MSSKNLGLPQEIKRVKALSKGQENYIKAIDNNIVIMCSGLAGTGKSFIAVAKAAEALLDNKFEKIVVARPAVECGESLGFLPGDIQEKFDPYMKPITDVFSKYFFGNTFTEHLELETIELCPLAYMRGRTFHKTFMILDEAQNATLEQTKMFLTRIGKDSKAVLSGDITQTDIPGERGLAYENLLNIFDRPPYVDGVEVVHLGRADIVRHTIVQKILEKLGE
jgi:phosphate starvation-inducible PhoH-like protein